MDRRRTDVRCLVLAVIPCAVLMCGCAEFRVPQIDPTGQRVFVEPGPRYRDEPGALGPWDPVDLLVTPRVTVAPVGSEVVLMAGVRDQDQYLVTNERVEWTLDPASVGEFVQVQPGSWCNLLVGDFTRPRKIDATYAIATTSRQSVRLTRGTPATGDDVCVLSGQTWITVTSPVEGTSLVTAFAPSVHGWEQRKQTATIHWIDAQWRLPPPAINPAGTRHVFTTTVVRLTDQSPCTGWRVRYQVVDGPAAGFVPDGSPSIEVQTNALGQGSAEMFQRQPAPGTNRVEIQVIRPATPGGRQIVVGTGSTLKTWSSPGLAVRKMGPAVAGVGATVTYRIEVSNPGDMPADDVLVVDEIPEIMSFVGSNPPAALTGRTLQWKLGRLAPRARQAMDVSLRADRLGSAASCAEATAAGGLKARECVTTTVAAAAPATAALGLQVTGPDRANVGDEVTFDLVVTNRGDTSADNLVIRDRFDAGFQHAKAASPIERKLMPLGPRQSVTVKITFRVAGAGRLCHTVELLDNNAVRATAQACLTASPGLPTTPPVTQPQPPPGIPPPAKPTPPSKPAGPAAVTVKITGPALRNVGETTLFSFDVTNTGEQALTNVKVVNDPPKELEASQATAGYQFQGDSSLAWTVDSLLPGRSKQFRVEYRPVQAAKQACVRVRVTSDQGAQNEDRACLEIRALQTAAAAGLSLKVVGLHNPIAQGKELTYEIQVANQGQTAAEKLVLEVAVPPQVATVRLQTTGPEGPKYSIDDQTKAIRFDPVAKLDPGRSLSYRVRVYAKEAGEAQLRAKLISPSLAQPLTAEEKTTILPSQ